jgi:methylenetetrahydrofolate reductase (NADPH)
MLLTISSQPAVNAVRSNDETYGWGPNEYGYIFQKPYFEFFAPPEFLNYFINEFKSSPTISYSAINVSGELITNLEETHTVAMTWGVFPNCEILQPTIADVNVFKVWKDEAFYIWKEEWGSLYAPDSRAREMINYIHDRFYLVQVIDNDFINGTLNDMLRRIMARIRPINSYIETTDAAR